MLLCVMSTSTNYLCHQIDMIMAEASAGISPAKRAKSQISRQTHVLQHFKFACVHVTTKWDSQIIKVEHRWEMGIQDGNIL